MSTGLIVTPSAGDRGRAGRGRRGRRRRRAGRPGGVPGLGALDTLDGGNIIRLSRADAVSGAAMADYFADSAHALTGQTIPASAGALHYTTPPPACAVALLRPHNHPIMFAPGNTAAPPRAGHRVLLQPPHQAPPSPP